MVDIVTSMFRGLLAVVGAAGAVAGPDAGVALLVTAAVVAAAVAVAVVASVALAPTALRALARPRGLIDESAPLAQSDPDAAGHTRSRAPGVAVSAA